MVSSVLLHFGNVRHDEPIIRTGVELARRAPARIRGLTLVDTRRLSALSSTCEAAAYSAGEATRLDRLEADQDQVRHRLTQACLTAGIDFDVRRMRGNPLEVLPSESQFHDLVVTAVPPPDAADAVFGLSAADVIDLLFRGVQPMLVLRGAEAPLARVLLIGDGSPAAARAMRQFLQQRLLPNAELRLLAVGSTERNARASLAEMVDYCRGLRLTFESGWICGNPRRVVAPYALKWGASLVVTGAQREGRVARKLLGDTVEELLTKTSLSVYTTG